MKDKALRDAREEQQELEALHRLDEECVHQQRAGNYLKAFDCMERALVLRRHFFGIESEEVIQACRALAEMCNLLAMSFLQQDNYAVTIDLLKKAEVLTQRHHPAERATTLNNLACYYRRLGKLHSAMTSLKRALELEKRLENARNAADTQLNMCAVLSQLGKHQEALEHAQEALITLQEGFIQGKHTTDGKNSEGDTSSARLDRISVMCIAYHNVGVEQEFLKDYAESVASYKKGIGLAEQYLGENHSITTTIRNSYLAAKRTLATKARVRPYSATRGQKSPAKAGSRLLLSPRSGSLRSPSPLSKEQSGPQIPTPRSIIADALSRAPLSALPPLEVQSPPSAGTKKKKKNDTRESKSEAPANRKRGLKNGSPTDPFFSPRFRFDEGSVESKAKKPVSTNSPRSSAAAATVEVQTPASSKGKRERRKSSVKKPPSTAEQSERRRKSGADEQTNTAPTPQPSEEGTSARAVESQSETINGNSVIEGELLVSPATDAASLFLAESSGEEAQFASVGTSDDHDAANNEQSCTTPRQLLSVEQEEQIVDSEVDAVEGAISIVLTKVIDKIVELDQANCSDEASIERTEEIAVVNAMPEQEEAADNLMPHNPVGFGNDGNSADSFGVLEYAEVEHQDDFVLSGSYGDYPAVAHVEDAVLPSDEQQITSELAGDVFEEAHTKEPHQLEADYAVENDSIEGGHEFGDPIQDSGALVYESAIDSTQADEDFAQHASHFDNAESNEADEAPPETRSETPIENDAVSEINEATAATDEHLQLSPDEGEESGAIDDGVVYNEEGDRNSPGEALPELSDEQLDTPEGELVAPTSDVGELVVDQEEAEESQLTNDLEEIAPDLETHVAEVDPDHEHCEESYASADTIAGIEAQQEVLESDHQDEVDHDTSVFIDESEQPATYELQGHEGEEAQCTSEQEPQHDWPHDEHTEPSMVENAGDFAGYYYQEASVPSHEELTSYADNTETPAYYNDSGDDGSALLPDAPIPDDGTVDVDFSAQDPAAIE